MGKFLVLIFREFGRNDRIRPHKLALNEDEIRKSIFFLFFMCASLSFSHMCTKVTPFLEFAACKFSSTVKKTYTSNVYNKRMILFFCKNKYCVLQFWSNGHLVTSSLKILIGQSGATHLQHHTTTPVMTQIHQT